MTFGSSWMLWGVALGAIPIVIHLLHRRRHREVRWAAMQFLLEATRKNSRRIRLEHLLLLIVRTLILVLLAVALARPFVASVAGGATGRSVHRVIVLDATYSMLVGAEEDTRFERAREIVRGVLRSSKPGDVVNLVVHRAGGPRVLVQEPSARMDDVLGELDRIDPTHEAGDLTATLRAASEILDNREDERAGELVFVGDLQRRDWDPEDEATRDELTALLAECGREAAVTLVDVAETSPGNAAVADVRTDADLVTVGETFAVSATLLNHGGEPLPGQSVELLVDGRLVARKSIDLPARGTASIEFAVDVGTPGEHAVTVARAEPDALPLDDRRSTVVRVRDEINVLLVDGTPSPRFAERATGFLEVALSPDRRAEPWRGVLRPRVVRESELPDVDLNLYECVFLCNVGLLTDRETSLLRRYVRSGGGLVISLGDRVRVDEYDRLLYATDFTFADVGLEVERRRGELVVKSVVPGSPARTSDLRPGWTILSVSGEEVDRSAKLKALIEAGSLADGLPVVVRDSAGRRRSLLLARPTLLPGRLADVVETASDGDGFLFDAADLSHPVVRAFEGNPDAGLLTTRIPTYVKVEPNSLTGSRVALRFANGDPVVVEKSIGRGRSLLITTSLDRNWAGTWPGRLSFPQLMQEIVAFGVARADEGALPVGDPYEATFPGVSEETRVDVVRPDGGSEGARVDTFGEALEYARTDRAGVYSVDVGPPVNRETRFAVALDPSEGDLERVSPEVLEERLPDGGRVRTEWAAGFVGLDESSPENPLAAWLLAIVGCLLLVETLMAWRFPVGFGTLLVLVAVGLALRIVSGHVLVAGPALLILVAGAAWWARSAFWLDRADA